MQAGFVNQKYYQVSACLGEMVSSSDETDLENCRQISEVTVASDHESAIRIVKRQFACLYPRKDGYVVSRFSAKEV